MAPNAFFPFRCELILIFVAYFLIIIVKYGVKVLVPRKAGINWMFGILGCKRGFFINSFKKQTKISRISLFVVNFF